jgi:hypothetical protein
MGNRVILDPTDPTVAFISSASEAEFGCAVGMATLSNVHLVERCQGRACVIHNPSDHPMRDWDLHWRDDRYLMERLCPCCGVGHPDPDDVAYQESIGNDSASVHGCYGCCRY